MAMAPVKNKVCFLWLPLVKIVVYKEGLTFDSEGTLDLVGDSTGGFFLVVEGSQFLATGKKSPHPTVGKTLSEVLFKTIFCEDSANLLV